MQKVASLRYGVIFKKAFSDPVIFTAFVKAVLGIEIHIDRVETEKTFDTQIGSIKTSFDLFAEDKEQRIVVEIQHVRYPDHYHRFLNYHCVALLEQVINARDYRPSLQLFTIVVLTSGDKHGVDVATIDFDPKDLNGKPLEEIPHKIMFLCPKYVNDSTPVAYRDWLRLIDDSLDGEVEGSDYPDPYLQQVLEKIRAELISPEDRARMFDEYSEEQVRQEKYQEGLKRGELQAMSTLINTMYSKGQSIAAIAQMTGLPVDKVSYFINLSANE
jgi:predicted transposase/invertase (TIGR01784 family)